MFQKADPNYFGATACMIWTLHSSILEKSSVHNTSNTIFFFEPGKIDSYSVLWTHTIMGGGGVGGISRKSTKNNVFFLLYPNCYLINVISMYMHLTLHRKWIITINLCNVDICTGLLKNKLSSAKTTVVISHTFANTHVYRKQKILRFINYK